MIPGSHGHWCRWGQHPWKCPYLVCELPYVHGCHGCLEKEMTRKEDDH